MEKIIVNKTVASWIEQNGVAPSPATKMLWILENVRHKANKPVGEILEEQNIDLITLAKAIQYGYELPYEFKVGDIVERGTGPLFIVEGENNPNYETTLKIMEDIGINQYKLVCKSENREDGI